jgi:hypothetical protein
MYALPISSVSVVLYRAGTALARELGSNALSTSSASLASALYGRLVSVPQTRSTVSTTHVSRMQGRVSEMKNTLIRIALFAALALAVALACWLIDDACEDVDVCLAGFSHN